MATASFVGIDTTTQGSWIGVYGADGYAFPYDMEMGADSLPGYVSEFTVLDNVGGAVSEFHWGHDTTSARRLQNPLAPTQREGLTWYTANDIWLTVDVGATTRRLALYLLDDDSLGRSPPTIDACDGNTGTVLDTADSPGSFKTGKWVLFDITGRVTFKLHDSSTAQEVVSAVMFDTPGGGGGFIDNTTPILAAILGGGF